MGLLDDNLGNENGKKAQAGVSTYGINIPLNGYRVFAKDDDSLFTSSNPGAAGVLTLNGALINESNLNFFVLKYTLTSLNKFLFGLFL